MKGKTLFLLVQDLSKPEKHKLLNQCKKSNDKRHASLYSLVKKNPSTEKSFSNQLEKTGKELFPKNNQKERDKTTRRFIDFSVKEIENLKIQEYLSTHSKTRNYLLAEIYNKTETKGVFAQYNKKAHVKAAEENDTWMESFLVDQGIVLVSDSQRKKDLIKLKELILYKNSLANKIYHEKLSSVYDLLSALYLEDAEIADELEGLMLSDEEIDALIKLSKGKPEAVEYEISIARFNFINEEKVSEHLLKAKKELEKLKANKNRKEILLARILFLDYLVDFHFGRPLDEVLKKTEEIIESNEKFGYPDPLSPYYNIMVRLFINNDLNLAEAIKERSKYLTAENVFLSDFLFALQHFLKEEDKKAMLLLNQLAYCPNYYVSIWSRTLEIIIHLGKGNISFCENLLQRAIRLFEANKGKVFTANSNAIILTELAKSINVAVPKSLQKYSQKTNKMSIFHEQIKNRIKKK